MKSRPGYPQYVYMLMIICMALVLPPQCGKQDQKKNGTDPLVVSSPPQGSGFKKIMVGNYPVFVELAITPEERARGLMYRYDMPENQGMLFIFDTPGRHSFYMKNTFMPLSIAFISKDYRIVKITDMAPLDEKTYHYPPSPVIYALEMKQGWFSERKIKAGTRVDLKSIVDRQQDTSAAVP